MSTFYHIDSSRISLKEYWWWGNKSPLSCLIWAGMKLLHIETPCSSDDPNTDSTLPFVVEQLPPEIATGFQRLHSDLAGLGFIDPVYHVIDDPGTRATIYWATYRHESGKHFARIHQRIWQQAQKPDRGTFPMFFTEFSGGTFLVSSAGKPDMDTPATVVMNRMPKAQCVALWNKHLALVEKFGQQKMIAAVHSTSDLLAATERHHILLRDFHLARKVFRPHNATEQATVDRYTSRVEAGRASGVKYPEIMAELDKLQEVKPAWRGAIWVLVGSALLFILIGVKSWDWKITLWLIPILFFHEGGHWITMRLFHYRNLRMFFIPLFGAAVTGQHWNVPGWKKALVALAGPLPGIFLGCILGLAGMVLHKNELIGGALLLIILNVLNLVPILPFDGGRFMQAILFCRNRWLDLIFRILTIVGIVSLSFAGFGRFIVYLAIPMAMALPVAFKLGRATDALREANLPPPNPGEDHIPTPTAEAIIEEVKTVLPTKLSNKVAAQHSLNVFETLNARPPGALATIALLFLYGGSLMIGVLACLLFMVAKEGKLSDLMRAAAHQPKYAFTCGNTDSWRGSGVSTNKLQPRNMLVTTLVDVRSAQATFASFTNRLPETAQLTLFGQSLLLSLPCEDDSARDQWFDQLQAVGTNTFVAVSNHPVTFSLNFIAATTTDATNMERALKGYFGSPDTQHLIPPWSPEAQRPGFETYTRARGTWHDIDAELSGFWTNTDLKAWNKKITDARKRGAMSEADRLSEEYRKAVDDARAAAVDKLRANRAIDPQLIDLHAQFSALNYTNRTAWTSLVQQVSVKLGRSEDNSQGARAGFARRNGLLIQIMWTSMNDASAGAPALTTWLCDHHCVGIRYEFIASFDPDDSDDDL